MKSPLNTCLICGIFFLSLTMSAKEAAPSLSLSKAAEIAEAALREKGLSKEHFLRSMHLTENDEGDAVFRATYAPPERRRVQQGKEVPAPIKLKYIEVGMDAQAKFIEKEMQMNRGSFSPKRKVIESD